MSWEVLVRSQRRKIRDISRKNQTHIAGPPSPGGTILVSIDGGNYPIIKEHQGRIYAERTSAKRAWGPDITPGPHVGAVPLVILVAQITRWPKTLC